MTKTGRLKDTTARNVLAGAPGAPGGPANGKNQDDPSSANVEEQTDEVRYRDLIDSLVSTTGTTAETVPGGGATGTAAPPPGAVSAAGEDRPPSNEDHGKGVLPPPQQLMTVEERAVGTGFAKHTWQAYIRAMGGFFFLPAAWCFSANFERVWIVGADAWVGHWTNHNQERAKTGIDDPPQNYFLARYLGILGVAFFCCCCTRLWSPIITTRAAKRMFENMLVSVARAPVHWFDTTPMVGLIF